jgi:hypothetical protein
MARPSGNSNEDENAKRKWDAWKEEEGISKTEAKRRYISFLIETMKLYASGTHEARELLSELEYLWDQIKDVQPGLVDEVDGVEVGVGHSPLNFSSPAFENSHHPASNSISYSGSVIGAGYDSFNESYLNQSLHHNHHQNRYSGNGIRSELRDVQLLKKEVNLALRRLNDEIITRKGNDEEKRRPSIFSVKLWEFLKLNDKNRSLTESSKKVLISIIKVLFKVLKKIVVEFLVLVILINLIKHNNGIELDLRLDRFEQSQSQRGVGFLNQFLFKILKYSKVLSLFNFSKIYINVD